MVGELLENDGQAAAERQNPIREIPAGRPTDAGFVLVDVVVGEAEQLLLRNAQRLAARPKRGDEPIEVGILSADRH
jgi:hypothetical protein